MTLDQFLTEHPPVEIEPHKLVSYFTGFSRSQSRKLIDQGGISVTRNNTDITISTDDFILKGDTLRVGKGRFYTV